MQIWNTGHFNADSSNAENMETVQLIKYKKNFF